MSKSWATRTRPMRLERRIEFSDYEQTRTFLERAADLAEERNNYPDMSFGRTHVSITLYPQEGESEITEALLDYASKLDALVPGGQQ